MGEGGFLLCASCRIHKERVSIENLCANDNRDIVLKCLTIGKYLLRKNGDFDLKRALDIFSQSLSSYHLRVFASCLDRHFKCI